MIIVNGKPVNKGTVFDLSLRTEDDVVSLMCKTSTGVSGEDFEWRLGWFEETNGKLALRAASGLNPELFVVQRLYKLF